MSPQQSWEDLLARITERPGAATWRDFQAAVSALHGLAREQGLDLREVEKRTRPVHPKTASHEEDAQQVRPLPWRDVRALVDLWAAHLHPPGEDEARHRLVRRWADAYRACGGEPEPAYRATGPVATPGEDASPPAADTQPTTTGMAADGGQTTGCGEEADGGPAPLTPHGSRPQRIHRRAAWLAGAGLLLGAGVLLLVVKTQGGDHDDAADGRPAPATVSSTGGATGTQPYVDAEIAWSNDEDASTDPEDADAIVLVYPTYRTGYTGGFTGRYHRTDPIKVKCQVEGGRVIELGPYYTGPTPHRDGIWYLMSTGEWVPAVYVDTGEPGLPACSATDADAAA
ncbi:hypothetical protein [Streptomyces glaucescens]|uniref:Putative thiopeptide-lantipeptide biosynthesis related protein n=1 Tax=Streptomyces glaucescens TaxID=1907 RepID=A0A089WXN5_STRGA|nr:hypothetical protein [Streptomyces glaucescens]AIR96187.1 putative thiopeptide-lantipeptide biosynthesis related protein [Streptomyces glaucescens]